jgi:tripartite-type tricarboxylate transporter receptor subunit TctC
MFRRNPSVPTTFINIITTTATPTLRARRSRTSEDIVDKLDKETDAGLADPDIKARLAELGGTVLPSSPADFGKLIVEETEKWAKGVKFAGIKAD